MSEKWDDNDSAKKTQELSKSLDKNVKADVVVVPNASKEPPVKNLIISLEEYAGVLTKNQRAAIREKNISRFPDLFNVKGLKEDILSVHPLVEMSNEAMLYTALFEETLKLKLKNLKEKKKKTDN